MDTGAPEATAQATPALPGDLGLVMEFVNSLDVEPNTDLLAGVAGLRSWLLERGVVTPAEARRLTAADAARVREFREAVRALLRANHGDPLDAGALAVLDTEARRPALRVHFTADGGARLVPAGEGADRLVARVLGAIAAADVEGTWRRLKVCAEDSCAWAYYDVSRNGSRAWCSMRVCGNRAKARRHRTRTRATSPD
ncbi:MAG TPA: CGNR zinc finger domain-containing protein [Candidatus Dormibacteraeota bacterium]|jgi:predicted RNA-binding Zn ribbon-like protein|nr:CGNR zinc finger domain-containing protein [Candidatus Dormibacteraeota bacterium]